MAWLRRPGGRLAYSVGLAITEDIQDAILAIPKEAWTQMLALAGPARHWEPKRLRLRIFACAGQLARGGRRLRLRLAGRWPWAADITTGFARIQALAPG